MNRLKENTMTKLGLVGVSALSLMLALAAPATAQDKQQVVHRARHAPLAVPAYGAYGEPSLPVDQAIRFGYSQGYANYPSGWGGLYGDGRYPDNTVINPRYNTLH
jgi:hypothetical protein